MVWQIPATDHSRVALDFRVETGTNLSSWGVAIFEGNPDPGETRYYLISPGLSRSFYRLTPRYPNLGSQSGRSSGLIGP